MADLPPLPFAVTTVGPCMFGGQPDVPTPLYTADQLQAYARACLVERDAQVAALVEAVSDVYGDGPEDAEPCPPNCPTCRIRKALAPFKDSANGS